MKGLENEEEGAVQMYLDEVMPELLAAGTELRESIRFTPSKSAGGGWGGGGCVSVSVCVWCVVCGEW